MKKNKKIFKNKIIKKISILCVLILIIMLLIILINNIQENKVTEKLNYINGTEWNDEIYPEGMPIVFKLYDGKLTAQNIGKSIYHVVTEIFPKYNMELKGFTNDQIKKYYEKNKNEIFKSIGNISEIEFISIINEISTLTKEKYEIEAFYFDINSIVIRKGYLIADLHIKYKGCEEFFVEIQVLNDFKADSSSVKYYK